VKLTAPPRPGVSLCLTAGPLSSHGRAGFAGRLGRLVCFVLSVDLSGSAPSFSNLGEVAFP